MQSGEKDGQNPAIQSFVEESHCLKWQHLILPIGET